ncbi:histidine kinase [Salipaludibacillus neizhouensis]|uniref:histidine kinase n=1 Tax=Salipaludibacillus neizhouensis TaxID=885475 RepID=A0A3A9KDB8_9BACI|nr:sensor histidine kinase [Salipaludibacillus neizhouensis]RKL65425.1 histidine kinase [Salipaludibacillus neizhouensis]
MIKIRTKLLIYFVAILLLIVLAFFIRDQNDQKVMELYDENVEHFFLLNEMTKITNQTFQSLQIYVHEPLPENLSFYQEDKQNLLELQQEFSTKETEGIPKKNYLNLLRTFLEQADQTVEGVNKQDIRQYSMYLNEADQTSSYIHEKTLELINQELTNYKELSLLMDTKITYTEKTGTAMITSIILLSILFALWFSNGITKTIGRLSNAAKEISAGNYSGEDVVVSRKDELWHLTNTFNEMKGNINQSVTEIEEKARLSQLLKEMELKSLQNQINPHFLFNTLNTISKTSYIEGAERTSDLISSVSALLRYNIGNLNREIELKDEVETVKEYFFIQTTRFGDRVAFEEKIDPACLSTPLPCLTLQPIIENAFMHGIEDMAEGAIIALTIYQLNERVCIEVTDNGVGMDQQTIDRLLDTSREQPVSSTKKSSGHSTGIGMKNVITRLKLFDKESNVEIDSKPGKGTTVRIYLSKQERGGGK